MPLTPLRGIFAPVTTPFAGDDLDLAAFRRNARHYATTPLAGLVVLGSNGEAASLDDDESDADDRGGARGVPAREVADCRHRARVRADDARRLQARARRWAPTR